MKKDPLDRVASSGQRLFKALDVRSWTDLEEAFTRIARFDVRFSEAGTMGFPGWNLVVHVDHAATELEYPLTGRLILAEAQLLHRQVTIEAFCSSLEQRITSVEQVHVVATIYIPPSPYLGYHIPKQLYYPYKRAIKGDVSVSRWRKIRIRPWFGPRLTVDVQDAHGRSIHGSTLMKNARVSVHR